MPAVDDPFSIAASLPGQMATLKGVVKDLGVNNTQALTQALAAATAAAASAADAAASAQASIVTPVTTVATSSATALPFTVTATMVVPAGATRCFYTATASVYGQSPTAFQVGFSLSAPSAGSDALVAGGGSAPLSSSNTSVAVGFLTGLTPGATLNFTVFVGYSFSGSLSYCATRVQALAVFQP